MLSHFILGRFGVLEWKLLELHILECSHNCCHPVFLGKPVKLHECRNKGAFFIIINWHSFLAGMYWQVFLDKPQAVQGRASIWKFGEYSKLCNMEARKCNIKVINILYSV